MSVLIILLKIILAQLISNLPTIAYIYLMISVGKYLQLPSLGQTCEKEDKCHREKGAKQKKNVCIKETS